MTDSIAVLEDGHQRRRRECYGPRVEVAALIADVGRPRMMTTNSTGDRLYFVTNLGSVINVANFLRGRIIETNCILENTPPPLFGLNVVYKIGGRINGTLRYMSHFNCVGAVFRPRLLVCILEARAHM